MAEALGISVDFVDPRIICLNTGEICEAKASIVQLYDTHVDAKLADSMPDEFNPRYDHMKLNLRLAEYDARAKIVSCDSEEDSCTVRTSMDESQIRVGVVRSLRRILRKG